MQSVWGVDHGEVSKADKKTKGLATGTAGAGVLTAYTHHQSRGLASQSREFGEKARGHLKRAVHMEDALERGDWRTGQGSSHQRFQADTYAEFAGKTAKQARGFRTASKVGAGLTALGAAGTAGAYIHGRKKK